MNASRTPNVFVFNPFAEARIAQGRAFTPTKHQAQLARDLANLPQYLCRQDDIVLVGQRPTVEFLSSLKQAGFALPEFVELNRSAGLRPGKLGTAPPKLAGAETCVPPAPAKLSERKLGRLRPWAWGPDSVELFESIFANLTGERRIAGQSFNSGIAQLYSKAWSAELLKKILSAGRAALPRSLEAEAPQQRRPTTDWAGENWLCTEHEVGVAVATLDNALAAIAAIRGRGRHRIVVKQSLGLAGSNALRLFEPVILDTHRRWMEKALENRRQLVIEPWLERQLDFSVQLEMTVAGLKLCGYTGLINDLKGQFQANWAAPGYKRRIPANVLALFPEPADIANRLHRLYADIFAALEIELRRADYLGPVGIDAFVYRGPDGRCRLKPIVEINPRYTMGRVLVGLMRQACPGSHGLFRLVNRAQARAEGFDDFAAFAQSLAERFPLRLAGEPAPRIRAGALCLNDPAQTQACLAVFQVTCCDADFDSLTADSASKSSQRS